MTSPTLLRVTRRRTRFTRSVFDFLRFLYLALTIRFSKCGFGNKGFNDYHRRLQTFLLWFIEGVRYIEDEDLRWNIYVLCVSCLFLLAGNLILAHGE